MSCRGWSKLVLLVGLFLVVASHLGAADHAAHMSEFGLERSAMAVPATLASADPMVGAGTASSLHASAGHGGHGHGYVDGLSMVCQFMLVAVVSAQLVRRALRSWRPALAAVIGPIGAYLKSAVAVLWPARPPGLAMLCVARC